MRNDRLDILIEQTEDIPHWMFCRLMAVLQWNV
jgi:hypothetical protein